MREDANAIAVATALWQGQKKSRLAMLRAMSYIEYLRSPEWKAKSAEALAKAHHCCHKCAEKIGLEVHHRTYERLGCELPEDLVVLCARHHDGEPRHGTNL